MPHLLSLFWVFTTRWLALKHWLLVNSFTCPIYFIGILPFCSVLLNLFSWWQVIGVFCTIQLILLWSCLCLRGLTLLHLFWGVVFLKVVVFFCLVWCGYAFFFAIDWVSRRIGRILDSSFLDWEEFFLWFITLCFFLWVLGSSWFCRSLAMSII